MSNLFSKSQEKELHNFFEITIFLKGFLAILEIVGGVVIFFISRNFVGNLLFYVSQEEIFSNPDSFIFTHAINFLENFTYSTQHFIAYYLLIHGVVKLFIVWSLYKEKIWAYPVAILVFGFFAIYEVVRFTHTHSVMLLFVITLDILVIGLTWHEYDYKICTKK